MTRTKTGRQALPMKNRAIDEPSVKLAQELNKKGKQS